MLYSQRIGRRLAIGWTMGGVVSALGIYLSVALDLPTGPTMVCTFGLVLILMALVKPLFVRVGLLPDSPGSGTGSLDNLPA
jgi:ABC-type Mn2+/Zn2+ transport system permease subunit